MATEVTSFCLCNLFDSFSVTLLLLLIEGYIKCFCLSAAWLQFLGCLEEDCSGREIQRSLKKNNKTTKNQAPFFLFDELQWRGNSSQGLADMSSAFSAIFSFFIFSSYKF